MATPARPRLASPPPLAILRSELRRAVSACLDRNLSHSAKFAAELLEALPPSSSSSSAPPHASTSHAAAREPHVHFRTSTPVRADPRPSFLPGLPPIAAERARGPRDSLGSVLSIGEPGSSPGIPRSIPRSRIAEEDEQMDAEGQAEPELDDEQQATRSDWSARDDDERDTYLLALAYVRSHELMRAAHALRRCSGPKARWLRCYAKYLAGEKRAQEDAGEPLGQKDRVKQNPYTQELLAEMADWEPGFVSSDGWLLYLKALLFLSLPPVSPSPFNPRPQPSTSTADSAAAAPPLDLRLAALETLVQSVKLEPYNWSAWVKIAACLDGPEELEATLPFLPACYPLLFFFVHATLEIHSAGDNLYDVLDELEKVFPGSHDLEAGVVGEEREDARGCSVVRGMRALVHYHVREFDESTALFTSLQKTDPYRVEDIDIFSNILYVSEKRAELATLAQEYTKMDRMRPEVCCLVGNYYSLRRDHEKAILYFRRALKLDRGYLSAWTLMGHEYIEIKNTNAAIASYRRAVDVNRKDYRAWYGLGQTYELLGEPFYALNYYQRATALRPYDPRMWSALATCYEKLKRVPDAIQCHQRALVASDPVDTEICLRIGRLYALQGQPDRAASYHRRALAEGLGQGATAQELSQVYVWLAKWEMQREKLWAKKKDKEGQLGEGEGEGGDLEKAEEYLRIVQGVQEDRDEAKALLKELEVLMLSRE
ncbi:hypothetical protein JCM1840_000390 [Sporobolomyces johnsonii]